MKERISFKGETTSLPIYFKDKGVFKNAPITNEDGKVRINPEAQGKVREALMDREHDLEEYSPKKLTDEQQAKITEISNFLTGKASSSFSTPKAESKPSSEDFEFEDNFTSKTTTTTSVSTEEDDFFADL